MWTAAAMPDYPGTYNNTLCWKVYRKFMAQKNKKASLYKSPAQHPTNKLQVYSSVVSWNSRAPEKSQEAPRRHHPPHTVPEPLFHRDALPPACSPYVINPVLHVVSIKERQIGQQVFLPRGFHHHNRETLIHPSHHQPQQRSQYLPLIHVGRWSCSRCWSGGN